MAWLMKLLQSAGIGTVTPPPAADDIVTEDDNPIITEDGDNLVTED